MKILFDTRQYVLDNEVRRLAESVEVVILEREGIKDSGSIARAKNIKVKHVGSGLERFLAGLGLEVTLPTYIKNYRAILKEVNPDVIVAADFFRLSSWQAIFYRSQHPKVRLVILSETKRYPSRLLSRIIMRLALSATKLFGDGIEKLIVYTEEGRDFLRHNLPTFAVSVVPPSIDTDFFRPEPEHIFLKDGTLNILMNARFAEYKRHRFLLKALARIKSEGYNFRLTLIGRDMESQSGLDFLCQETGLSAEVSVLPSLPRDRLPALYGRHDMLILPSYNEALGMVVPEAMACGLGTITSDTVGANVYVVPGATGLIFRTDDLEDLLRNLRLCFDRERLRSWGELAREHIVKEHSQSLHGGRLMKELL